MAGGGEGKIEKKNDNVAMGSVVGDCRRDRALPRVEFKGYYNNFKVTPNPGAHAASVSSVRCWKGTCGPENAFMAEWDRTISPGGLLTYRYFRSENLAPDSSSAIDLTDPANSETVVDLDLHGDGTTERVRTSFEMTGFPRGFFLQEGYDLP